MDHTGLEASLKRFVPNLFLLTEPEWETIEEKINERYEKRLAASAASSSDSNAPNNQYINSYLDYNFYDLVLKALEGDSVPILTLNYFNIIFGEIAKILPLELKERVNDNMKKLLHTTKSDYIHYIGELAVLNSLIETGEYELTGIEVVIVDKKTAEFGLLNKNDRSSKLVEVYNVHITADTTVEDLIEKLQWKVNDKSKGNDNNKIFTVIPVLWSPSYKDLENLSVKINEAGGILVECTYEPVAFGVYYEGDEKFSYRFSHLRTLFSR